MDFAEALELVIARTKHERYRALCDPASPDYRPEYAGLVMRLASEAEPAPDPSSAEAIRARRAAKPRLALGVDQHKIPSPGCVTCAEKAKGA